MAQHNSSRGLPRRRVSRCLFAASILFCLASFFCTVTSTHAQQAPEPAPAQAAAPPSTEQQVPGSITGTVLDQTGVPVAGAHVRLTRNDQTPPQAVLSDDNGQFSFTNVAPGAFQLLIMSQGLAAQSSSGTLHPGEKLAVPQISLAVASASIEVRVSPEEEAEVELKAQEKQRVLGFVPNFYVTYVHDAVPLNPRQKFQLAWKSTADPVSLGVTAAVAGIEQSQNAFSGYGQGAQGYAKRFGASYADLAIGTFLGGAVLPTLLKQDPRYFYKGSGSKRGRILYALANAVICKGDNGRWQPNYSAVLGTLAAGGISNLYYPASDRGARLTFENAGISLAATAGVNVLQEFVIRKLTPARGVSASP